MKITYHEIGDYVITLQAETLEDAAFLARMGINSVRQPPAIFVHVDKDYRFKASVYVRGTKEGIKSDAIKNQFRR